MISALVVGRGVGDHIRLTTTLAFCDLADCMWP
jgi:hypothetical protein